MKKLLLLSVLGLAACTETRGVHGDWVQGARFAPNDVVEYRARAKRGEPGVFPAPSGYSVYTRQQRIAAGAASADGVIRKGTASSRTGVYSGPGHNARGEPVGHNRQGAQASTTAGNSPHRSNALVAAKSTTTGGQSVNIGNETLKVYHIDVGDTSYAVFRKPSFTGPATIDRAQEGNLQAALPSLTGCSSVAGPFMFGPYGKSNTHMVYALNCG